MSLPSFETYGRYASSNYGAHALVFTDGDGRNFYFSYRTLVAFTGPRGLTVRENDWGPTTGKHLNWIDGGDKDAKKRRLSGEDFERAYQSSILARAA